MHGSSQALNRYAYVLNNPLNAIDPNGKWPIGIYDTPNETVSVVIPTKFVGNEQARNTVPRIVAAAEAASGGGPLRQSNCPGNTPYRAPGKEFKYQIIIVPTDVPIGGELNVLELRTHEENYWN